MNHVELFAGIGGISIAAEWAGFRTIAQVERDPFCLKILEQHWPDVHRCREIRDFPDRDYGAVTLVSGGFPCQPFSAAGKRRGKEDDRYLWPEMRRVIAEIKPTWVVAENVTGLISMAQFDSLPELGSSAGNQYRIGDVYHRTGPGFLKTILEEIEALGYEVTPIIVPAAGAGAPHYRYRVFVVAHAECNGRQQGPEVFCGKESVVATGDQDVAHSESMRGSTFQRDEPNGVLSADVPDADKQHGDDGGYGTGEVCREQREETELRGSKDATNSSGAGLQNGDAGKNRQRAYFESTRTDSRRAGEGWTVEPGVGDLVNGFSTWLVEPNILRVAKGVKDRVSKLRALGNAVVPPQIYPILKAIAEVERESIQH